MSFDTTRRSIDSYIKTGDVVQARAALSALRALTSTPSESSQFNRLLAEVAQAEAKQKLLRRGDVEKGGSVMDSSRQGGANYGYSNKGNEFSSRNNAGRESGEGKGDGNYAGKDDLLGGNRKEYAGSDGNDLWGGGGGGKDYAGKEEGTALMGRSRKDEFSLPGSGGDGGLAKGSNRNEGSSSRTLQMGKPLASTTARQEGNSFSSTSVQQHGNPFSSTTAQQLGNPLAATTASSLRTQQQRDTSDFLSSRTQQRENTERLMAKNGNGRNPYDDDDELLSKALRSNRTLEESNAVLEDTRRTVRESGRIGVDTLREMNQQGQELMELNQDLVRTEENSKSAGIVLRRMAKRALYNRIFLWSIILMLFVADVLFLYYAFIKK